MTVERLEIDPITSQMQIQCPSHHITMPHPAYITGLPVCPAELIYAYLEFTIHLSTGSCLFLPLILLGNGLHLR